MLSLIFPGQGVQRKGMLDDALAQRFPEQLKLADAVLGYSLRELCQNDPDGQLDRTEYTQPALFAVNALGTLRRSAQGEPLPDYALGHSLGEYNALFAAGVFDFETGLRLVQKRGQLMAEATGGAMAVVGGLRAPELLALLQQHGLTGIDLANLNTPLQTTISGLREELERARPLLEQAGARVHMLKVSGAFHSRHLRGAAEQYRAFLDDFRFNPPRFAVVSNVAAVPHELGQLKDNLVRHLTSPVRWVESIRHVLQAGVERFEESGPGTTLTAMIAQIRRDSVAQAGGEVGASGALALGPGGPAVTVAAAPVTAAPVTAVPVTAAPTAPTTPATPTTPTTRRIEATNLGSQAFRHEHGVRYACLAGSMYRGIASVELVARMGKAGMLGFFGTGGLALSRIEEAILALRTTLTAGQKFGMNLLCQLGQTEQEMQTVELFLRHGVETVEASGYMQLTAPLVRYRVAGLQAGADGGVLVRNKIIAKLSRPEVAQLFLAPPPEALLRSLQAAGQISAEQAGLARAVPMADDLCVEADSAGHTDRRAAATLLPAIMHLRDEAIREAPQRKRVRVGLAGGIGTPQAAAAAFVMGAEFILTGSINQCSVEAGNSDAVKDLLQQMDVQDTDYAPAGDMFEIGSQIQVLKKGLFFSARANRLHELYRQHEGLEQIDGKTLAHIEQKYFGRSMEAVYAETRSYWLRVRPAEIERAERDPKHKMALVFKWYFVHTMRLALQGSAQQRFDYQVHCGPALGAFNRWVKGTPLEDWRNRHVDEIAEKLMRETAEMLEMGFARLLP
jgi:trans-AT polyketide synthase, acyltransferase and oxidoreductase domains